MIVVFRIIGVFALMIPAIPARIKEWAYAGFTIEFFAASISHTIVDGFGFNSILPMIIFGILVLSYFSYHKKQSFNLNNYVVPSIS